MFHRIIERLFSGPVRYVRIAEIFLGLFFLGTAIWKWYAGSDFSLQWSLRTWEQHGWIPHWYSSVLRPLVAHETLLTWGIILLQGSAGALIVLNRHRLIAGILLLSVQLGIFLATFFKLSLREFTGLSLWFALYCIATTGSGRVRSLRLWSLLTLLFSVLYLSHLLNVMEHGQHLLSEVDWQRRSFAADMMPVSVTLKWFVYEITGGEFGAYLWIAPFWIQALAFPFLFTRYRLIAGAVLLVIEVGRAWLWISTLGGYATLWVLVPYLWCTMEFEMEEEKHSLRK